MTCNHSSLSTIALKVASLEERHQGQQSALVCKLQMEKEKHRTHASLVLGEREMHGKETDEWKCVGVYSVSSHVCMCYNSKYVCTYQHVHT